VKNRKLPIIKRKTFIMPYGAFMRFSDGTVLSDTLDYIERETDYDTGLIWDYLLANCNLKVLLDDLCLSRVLPAAFAAQDNPAKGSAAVFAHLYYEDLFEESLGVLQRVPERVDVYATTSSPEKKEALEALARDRGLGRLQVLLVDNRGRDISALLMGCREYVSRYEYACFWHDKKTAHNQYPQSGRCFADMLTECTLASRAYVENVLTEFEAHPRLGLVVPEAPYHGVNYRFAAGSYWASDFDQTMAVMSRLGLEVPMAASQDCPALGTAFWFRVAALKPLFDYPWKLSDFPPNPMPTDGSISHGIERVFPYVAQAEGYYTERAMPDTLARAVADDCRYMLNATVDATVENEDIPLLASTYFQFVTSLKESTRVLKMPYRRQRIRDAYVALSRLFPPVKKLKNYIRTHAKGLWRRF
jgi:rhamnosyltransferase